MKLSRAVAVGTLCVAATVGACKAESTAPRPFERAAGVARKDHPGEQSGAASVSEDRQAEIVREVLRSQYGDEYDRTRDCWKTRIEGEDGDIDYCMRAGRPALVETSQGKQLLFLAHNVQDFGASSREYVYGHLDSGLVGMFAVMVGNGQGRKLLAASKSEPFGLNGDCGCAGVQPTRLGRDLYGWILKYGDVAQGVVSSASSVFAPLDGRFSLIAVMPDIEEDRQRVSHRITFDDSNPQAEHYPLILTALMDGREIDRRRIEYDKARDRYPEVPAP